MMKTPLITGLMVVLANALHAQVIPLRVTADAKVVSPYPVSVVLSKSAIKRLPRSVKGSTVVSAQMVAVGKDKLKATFLVSNLAKGESRVYVLQPALPNDTTDLNATLSGTNAEVKRGENLIARYDVGTGPTKPFLYPIMPFGDGMHMTRQWPVENGIDEKKDHPHHRGLWFTHGDINGIDFWAESGDASHKIGKTVHETFTNLQSGPLQAELTAKTDWNDPDGNTIAKDIRTLVFTAVPMGLFLDFTVTISATAGDLRWGDTKEGTFAIRVPELIKGEASGVMTNAAGLTQGALWGKASPWVDNSGIINNKAVGIAIFDNPANPRFPTTWHARTYGLFAANPFGIHDFDASRKQEKNAGDLLMKKGTHVSFSYRLFFHTGNVRDASIGELGMTFLNPPRVTLYNESK